MHLSSKTAADLGWESLVVELSRRARTVRGAAAARVLPFLPHRDAVLTRQGEIAEARSLRDSGAGLTFDGIRDIDDALPRAGKGGVLDAQVLRDVASTLSAAAHLREHLADQTTRAPRLWSRAQHIVELDDVWQPIHDAFFGAEETSDGRPPRLADRASPALGPLRKRALKIREELERTVNGLLDRSHVAPHLQDRFATQRDDRYVIPVRVDARTKVRGIVHGMSQSQQTVFVEPEEIVELNNRLKLAELEVGEEERRILLELSRLVENALPEIHENLVALTALDVIDAAARLSSDLRAAPADIPESGGRIDLRRARHPLMVLSERVCIPNDIVIGLGQTLVISGPNAGGKTVALKTAGLCALMTAAGLHVPVQEGSTLPLFARVASDVGDDQSLERNLSTFSAHVLSLCEFLTSNDAPLLVLLDEIAVGTDPDQGAALAQAVLEALASRGATVIVTTHYDRLKTMAASDGRFFNASVGFDVEKLQPTYQLHLGVPGASGAVLVARRLGLSEDVCARATDLAGERTALESLLLTLGDERRKLSDEKDAVMAERAEAERITAAATVELEKAQARLEAARKAAHDDAVGQLRAARNELDRTRGVLRRAHGQNVTPAELRQVEREIDQAAELVHAAAPRPEPPPGRAATVDDLTLGREVWVQRLGSHAKVVGAPKDGRVQVQAGILKMAVGIDELRIASQKAAAPTSGTRGRRAWAESAPPAEARSRGSWPEVDVRGERLDAALGVTEKALDDALRTGSDGLLVIHGHGTGALRDGLRQRLREIPGVTDLRPGTNEEGGDGVTVVLL